MEVAPQPSQAELKEVLAGLSDQELRDSAARLKKSYDHLAAYHEELKVESLREQEELREDNAKLKETIDLMVKETQKLNISSSNVVEPELEEGPLNFIGRFWDKMRPRGNQVLLNEHVGELKRLPQDTTIDGRPLETPNPLLAQIAGASVAGQITDVWKSSTGAINQRVEGLGESFNDLHAQAYRAGKPLRKAGKRLHRTSTEAMEGLVTTASAVQAQAADLTGKVGSLEDIKAQAAGFTGHVQAQAAGWTEHVQARASDAVGSLEDLKAQAAGHVEKLGSFEDMKAQAQARAADLQEKASTFDFQAQAAALKEQSGSHFAALREKSGSYMTSLGGFTALRGGVKQSNLDEGEEVFESDEDGSAEQKELKNRAEKEAAARGASASSASAED